MGAVLICDDAVAYGALFQRWLSAAGIDDVLHARTAAEGVSLAHQLQPQVIVVDHLLPDATSDAVVPDLRAVAPQARVLLISGLPDEQLAAAAVAAGADGHIGKWATADAVREAVARLMD